MTTRKTDVASTAHAGASFPGSLKIALFGHDSNESTIRKRVAAFTASGADVLGLMFHRKRKSVSSPISCPNIDLGETADANYRTRLVTIGRSLAKVRGAREALKTCDVIYARNIDMLALAVLSKYALGLSAPIVYEALDVHPIFTKGGVKSRAIRTVERLLLKASSLLVVSSPTFVTRYFAPLQGYDGPWYLLENKVFDGAFSTPAEIGEKSARIHPPWVLGWFGILRCARSMELLCQIADTLGDKVVVHIRGTASEPDGITDDRLHAICSARTNMHFFGAYDSARDLEAIYGAVDIGWAVDFSAQGANSDWLIPNRIYESGLYCVPVVTRKDTTTGDKVDELAMGWTFDEPFVDNVIEFLSNIENSEFAAKITHLRELPPETFVDRTDTSDLLSHMAVIANSARQSRSGDATLKSIETSGQVRKT